MLDSLPLDTPFPIINNVKSLKNHKIQLAIQVLKWDCISHLVIYLLNTISTQSLATWPQDTLYWKTFYSHPQIHFRAFIQMVECAILFLFKSVTHSAPPRNAPSHFLHWGTPSCPHLTISKIQLVATKGKVLPKNYQKRSMHDLSFYSLFHCPPHQKH